MRIFPYKCSLAQDILLTEKMHPYTIKAAPLPRLFTRTSKVYLLLTSHTSPWLNSHTCIPKAFWGTKNCTCTPLGISNTYTYTNFMMNLDYLHNKVLHFMLFSSFCYLKPHANSSIFSFAD